MKASYYSVLILAGIVIYVFSCFPNKTAVYDERPQLLADTLINAPVKIYFADASQIAFPNGFEIKDRIVAGRGSRFTLKGVSEPTLEHHIPLDDISAMTYYQLKSSGASALGSMIMGLYGVTLAPLSVYCLLCPKCCFGSCPTVYVDNTLRAELFSYSISQYFQEKDLDRIYSPAEEQTEIKIHVANEAMETHYINYLQPLQVIHPKDSHALPDQDQNVVVLQNLNEVSAAQNSTGQDIRHLLRKSDNKTFRSDSLFELRLESDELQDWITLEVPVEAEQQEVYLALRLRNTLLTTILFYDLVMESQGVFALEWMNRMQTDYLYACLFSEIYQKYAGLRIYVLEDGQWSYKTRVGDVGPIAWKDMAIRVPIKNAGESVKIKLEFFPDNLMIDKLNWSSEIIPEDSLQVISCPLLSIQNSDGTLLTDLDLLLSDQDEDFLITYPGQSYHFTYQIKSAAGLQSSVFLSSQGYYIEWLRGNWITGSGNDYNFDMYDINGTISHLKASWLANRTLLENEFFRNRIPLQEDL